MQMAGGWKMLQRVKQRLGVTAQPKHQPEGSALPPNPLVGPRNVREEGAKPSGGAGPPEPGAEPSVEPRFLTLSLGPLLEMGN